MTEIPKSAQVFTQPTGLPSDFRRTVAAFEGVISDRIKVRHDPKFEFAASSCRSKSRTQFLHKFQLLSLGPSVNLGNRIHRSRGYGSSSRQCRASLDWHNMAQNARTQDKKAPIEHYVNHIALYLEFEASGPFVEESLQLRNGPTLVVLHIDWTVIQRCLT